MEDGGCFARMKRINGERSAGRDPLLSGREGERD
jgi:hypothetical protein